jgi:acyl-CoA hydrolase
MAIQVDTISECVKNIVKINTNQLVVGAPLGIGKPNQLLNAIWQLAKQDSSIHLEVFTALSLQVPKGKSLLEKRFLKPFTDRNFPDHPNLTYIDDVMSGHIPKNMKLTEFYMQSGKMLNSPLAQRHYTSCNYTHAARDMLHKGLNTVIQMVAVKNTENGSVYSLCSNTDLTLDIDSICKRQGLKRPLFVAMVNPEMPFMGGKAVVDSDFFDIVLDNEELYFQPFATPRAAVNLVDYNIGLLASTLIKDGGTLQVGIGSLADALIFCTKLRHEDNEAYLKLLDGMHIREKFKTIIKKSGSVNPYEKGLYAASEMFVEGFAHLFKANILKRKVYPDAQIQALINKNILTEKIQVNVIELLLKNHVLDEKITQKQMQRLQSLGILKDDLVMFTGYMQDAQGNKYFTDLLDHKHIEAIQENCLGSQLKQGCVLHAAFFLGSSWFYDFLRELSDEDRDLFQMVSVGQVNELYGGEALDREQRVNARFLNTCMKVDVLGAAASDTLDNNQVVSGVGGQYNFVAMGHALENSRSILMLRSTHKGKMGIESNIVWKYTYCTIPRHLRDVVITEYGIADLRGQSDEECIKRMICIADKQFQEDLRQTAVKYHKLTPDWRIPEEFNNNTKASLKNECASSFPQFPFGSDFTADELTIIEALKYLKSHTKSSYAKIKIIIKSYLDNAKEASVENYLVRMELNDPENLEEKLNQKLLKYALTQI